jgi:hypothetical protein
VIQAFNMFLLYSSGSQFFEPVENVAYVLTLIAWIWIIIHHEPLPVPGLKARGTLNQRHLGVA